MSKEDGKVYWCSEIEHRYNDCILFYDKEKAVSSISKEMEEKGYKLIKRHDFEQGVMLSFKTNGIQNLFSKLFSRLTWTILETEIE